MLTIFKISLFLNLIVFVSSQCSAPANCKCENASTDCSDADFQQWPTGIDTTTKVLMLEDNKISKISEDVLVDLTSLETLTLDSNKLTRVTLKIPSSLKRLTLSMNYLFSLELKNLSDTEFINLEYLKLDLNMMRSLPELPNSIRVLSIVGNQIKILPENTFAGLINLEEIFLQYNQIAEFKNDTFANLTNLRTLDIRSNMHTELYFNWFTDKPNLKTILLATVYLNCDCELVQVHYAIGKLQVDEEDLEEIRCYTPEELRGTPVAEMLEIKNFTECVPEVVEDRKRRAIGVGAAIIIAVMVLLLVTGVVAIFCFKNKEGNAEFRTLTESMSH